MKLTDALAISDLIRRMDDCRRIVDQMREQDKQGSSMLGPYYMSSEIWPQPSTEAARRAREILIADYDARRTEFADKLKSLGVELGEAA